MKLACEHLAGGRIIAIPTDTIYGIAGLAQSTDAVKKLYEIKGRSFEKPISISVGDVNEVCRYVIRYQCQYVEKSALSTHIHHLLSVTCPKFKVWWIKDTSYTMLKTYPPWYILLDYFTTRPSFKNLNVAFLTKWS